MAEGGTQSRAIDSEAWRTVLALCVALALAALVALPAVFGPGIVNTRGGGDSPFLVLRTHQMAQALRAGVFPVRWMPDAALGLGYPAFNYYAALPYYVSAAGYLGGLGTLGGIKLAQVIGFLLAGGAAFGLARSLGLSRTASVLASVAYSYAPFHLVNCYVRGDALSEFYAMGLFPLALAQVVLLARRPSVARALALALAYGALAVTHNISAMLASPLLLLWLVIMAFSRPREPRWRVLGLGVAAFALGLGLSAWFWLPALAERDLVQLVDQTTGYFHFAGHFRRLDLVQTSLLFDYTLDSSTNPFRMGLVQTVITALGLAAMLAGWMRVTRDQRTMRVLVTLCWVATTLLMTPLSRPVWDHVPLLEYAQFPWRWLSFQALFGALLIAHIPQWAPGKGTETGGRLTAVIALGVGALVIASSVAGLRVDRLTLTEADITPYRLMLYEAYSGNLGGTVRYEFLPSDMKPRPLVSATLIDGGTPAAPVALTGILRQATLESVSARRQVWRVELEQGGWLAFQTAAFPGWSGTLDGQLQGVAVAPGLGLLRMEVPAGEHHVTLTLGSTRVERWADRIAIVAMVLALASLVAYLVRARAQVWPALRVATVMLFAGAAFLLGSPAATAKDGAGPLVMDYVRSPYLHHVRDGVRMGSATLTAYEFDRTTAAPGDTVTIVSSWHDVPPRAALQVEMVALTAHLYPGSPAWAVARAPVSNAGGTLALRLPETLPPGLYALRPTLTVDGVTQNSATATGDALGLLSLQPIRVLDEAPRSEPLAALASFGATQGDPEITLRRVEAVWAGEDTLQVDMLWRSERQALRNYQLSVRLMQPDGTQVVARDLPPLVGNYPTSLWQSGHVYPDSLRIALPEGTLLDDVTDVEIVLYDGQTLAAIGSVAVPIQ